MKPRDLGSALAVALLVVPPVVYVPGLHDPFRTPKQIASEILALALTAALAWRAARAGCGARGAWSGGRLLTIATLPLAAVVAVSAVASTHPELALDGALGFTIALVAIWSLATWDMPLRPLLDWLALPAIVLAILMLVQHFVAGDATDPHAGDARLGLGSLAGNVGDLAAYLVLPALIAQSRLASSLANGRAREERARWLLWAWPVLLALWIATLVLARTLVPIAALAAGSTVLWATSRLEARFRGRIVVVASVLLLWLALLTPLRSRLAIEWHELRAGSLQDVLSGRLDGWRAGLHVGREHPLLGAGPGTYRAEFAPAKLALSERGVPFYQGHGYATHFDHAHDEPVEVFAELGIPGLLAAAWLLWFLARGALALPREERALALGMGAAFSVLALFWFPLRTALVGWPWVVGAAWLLGSRAPPGPLPQGAQPPVTRSGRGTVRTAPAWRRRAAYAATFALLVATAWVGYGGLQRMRASRVLRIAESDADQMMRRGRLDRGVLLRNTAALELAQRSVRGDERIPLAIGSHYLLLGDLASAESWYQSSLGLAPRAETYLNLGRAAWLRNDFAAARSHFANAVTLSPLLKEQVPSTGADGERAATGCGTDERTTVSGPVRDETFVDCSLASTAIVEGGTVVFRADESLALRSGFRVRRGAAFRAVSGSNGARDTLQSP